MPRGRLNENFERVTRQGVKVCENGNFVIVQRVDVPVPPRSLEQVLRDDRVQKAPLRQAKRAEVQRKKIEALTAIQNARQIRHQEEAAIVQQRIRIEVAVQTAAIKRRAKAAIKKNREKHATLSSRLIGEKRELEIKYAEKKRLYALRMKSLSRDLRDAKRPALELEKKWCGKHDSDLEFHGIQKYGVYTV